MDPIVVVRPTIALFDPEMEVEAGAIVMALILTTPITQVMVTIRTTTETMKMMTETMTMMTATMTSIMQLLLRILLKSDKHDITLSIGPADIKEC